MLLIIDNKSNFIKDYEQELIKQEIDFLVLPFYSTKEFSLIKSKVTGVILSGGPGIPHSPLSTELDFLVLKELNVPIMGFCLGAEIIADFYGSKINPLPEKQEKEQLIKVTKKEDPIFNNIKSDFIKLREKHSYQISTLPKDFEIIASSEICQIEAMKHKSKPIYAFQSHPEHSGKDGKTIMKNFLKLLK